MCWRRSCKGSEEIVYIVVVRRSTFCIAVHCGTLSRILLAFGYAFFKIQ